MATMIKEKHRNKKNKEKRLYANEDADLGEPPNVSDLKSILDNVKITEFEADSTLIPSEKGSPLPNDLTIKTDNFDLTVNVSELTEKNDKVLTSQLLLEKDDSNDEQLNCFSQTSILTHDLKEENLQPKNMDIISTETSLNNINKAIAPSAPIFEEIQAHLGEVTCKMTEDLIIDDIKNFGDISMSLEEAERLFCGTEIAQVRALSERELALVDNCTLINADHPLVDLLSTLRRSLTAVERERVELARSYAEEQKFRTTLWNIEKREQVVQEKCPCGASVEVRARYEYATLQRDRLPVARMRLEALARSTQENYCHHQHAALLAHCQIEEFVYDTLRTTNSQVRTALSLILNALRTSDVGPPVLSQVLQRWATALAARLIGYGHMSDLLFLWHQLFRQSRSVRWAARVITVHARDLLESSRAIALLDILLTESRRSLIDSALECTEDSEEVWEEVNHRGSGSAVADGSLREADLLALVRTLPLQEIVARLALIRHQNISDVSEYEWGDGSGGRGVMKGACGARVLLAALHRGVLAHPHYSHLADTIAKTAIQCLHALADLHTFAKSKYNAEIEAKINAELEAAMSAGWSVLMAANSKRYGVDRLPYAMLTTRTATIYFSALTTELHDERTTSENGIDIPKSLGCNDKLKIVAGMTVDRIGDFVLAKTVLDFLFQEAFHRKPSPCRHMCAETARSVLPRVLLAHPFLFSEAICRIAHLQLGEEIEVGYLRQLSLVNWSPGPQEMVLVLCELSHSNPSLLLPLLLALDCSPNTGLPLDTQLAIGSFLCQWVRENSTGVPAEWPWLVLRRLHVHRSVWSGCVDPPPPDHKPDDLFSGMFAVLATSWGHSVPMICEFGVMTLCELCHAGRSREALHCLSYVTRVMSHSPESIAFTPQFVELCTSLMETGPSLVQRAFRRGGLSGSNMIISLLVQQLTDDVRSGVNVLPLLCVWFHLCRSHSLALEAALVCCHTCSDIDRHLTIMLQDESLFSQVSQSVASVSPTLSLHVLRVQHTEYELRSGSWPRLLDALDGQRRAGKKTHVDNALKSIGVGSRAEQLVIHKVATASLAAPPSHPSHLLLWRLFFYLYLQKPPSNMKETTPPVGPLFFDGIIKSRIPTQLRKKLQDSAAYHRNEADKLKTKPVKPVNPRMEPVKEKSITPVTSSNNDLLPSLTLVDLTGESSDSNASSGDEDSDDDEELKVAAGEPPRVAVKVTDPVFLIGYHEGAERACREYLRWLMDGEKTRASPHNADTAYFISPQALNAAWNVQLERIKPPSSELEEASGPVKRTVLSAQLPPLQRLKDRLKKYKLRSRRPNRAMNLRPPLKDLPTDSRSLLKLIDQLLKDIVKLSEECEVEWQHVSSLDSSLWEFVCGLRVRRSFTPVQRVCRRNCPPINIVIPGEEWCVSMSAERGVNENRASARSALRRAGRARPGPAGTVAALYTAARCVRDPITAMSALECAWLSAQDRVEGCAPAKEALVAFVTDLAHRYICTEGPLCSQLVNRWSSTRPLTPLRQTLSAALISPRLLQPVHTALLYRTVLLSPQPPDLIFCQLSKFEIARWSENAEPTHKRELLESLTQAAQAHGSDPVGDYHMLIELLDVHAAAMLDAHELPAHIVRCARASAAAILPTALWKHLINYTEQHAHCLPPQVINTTLRELGAVWWAARSDTENKMADRPRDAYHKYVTHVLTLVRALTNALVRALQDNTHNTPEHVSWYTWTSTVEAWSPWVVECAGAPPLLCATNKDTIDMFIRTIEDIYSMVPGGEARLLGEVFVYAGRLAEAGRGATLLAALQRLPWGTCQWFHAGIVNTSLQLSAMGESEKSFLVHVLGGISREGWLAGVTETNLAPHLAALFYLFTKAILHEEAIEVSISLPWHRLPLMALEPALERFFMENHRTAVEYHKLPQFRVVLAASEMYRHTGARESAHEKRLSLVSHWVRAVSTPRTHDTSIAAILDHITALYDSSGEYPDRIQYEMEELISRALTILCTEPAAAAALPVCQSWLRLSPPVLVRASLTPAASLTTLQYCAALGDTAINTYLITSGGGWDDVVRAWSGCHWRVPHELVGRGHLLTGYTVSTDRGYDPLHMRRVIHTLTTIDVNFVEMEAELSLWVCRVTRAVREEGQGHGEGEVGEAGRELVVGWGQEPRRSILRAITMNRNEDRPSPRLRLLCRLALCVLSPDVEASIMAYEAAHTAVLGSVESVSWARAPHPKTLPKLAMKLCPKYEEYFSLEYKMASDT